LFDTVTPVLEQNGDASGPPNMICEGICAGTSVDPLRGRSGDMIVAIDGVIWRRSSTMEVGIRELRDHLSRFVDEVRAGNEVVVTDHGRAVARLVPLDGPRTFDRLVEEGLITRAEAPRRRGAQRRVRARGTVSDLVGEQRR
jgi:prevent-host-death family protein